MRDSSATAILLESHCSREPRSWNETGFCCDNRPTSKGSGWNEKMDHEIHEARYQEIEPGIVVLGAAFAASLLGMIFWVMV